MSPRVGERASRIADERLRSAIERLKLFRRVTDEGKEHLKRPPRLWTEMAIEHADGALQFIDSLPMTTTGKIMRRKLRESSG